MRRISARTRLVGWSVLVVLVVVCLTGALALFSIYRSLSRKLDEQITADFERIESALVVDGAGGVSVRGDEDDHLAARGLGDPLLYEVWDGDRRVAASDGLDSPRLGASEFRERLDPVSIPVTGDRRSPLRAVAARAWVRGRPFGLVVARSEQPVRHEVAELAEHYLMVLPFAAIVAALGGSILAGRALRPVAAMTAKAATISSDRLSERLPVANPHDEFGRLAVVFNALLDRLERSFDELRRFCADASHELRTPLAAMRATGEVVLCDSDLDVARAREAIAGMLEEVERMRRLVDSLLVLARNDAGAPVSSEIVDVGVIVRDVLQEMRVLAEEKRQALNDRLTDGLVAAADRDAVRRALTNVLQNAVQYTPVGGRIDVTVESVDESRLAVAVSDNGPGIAPEHLPRIFDRFYRVDPSRTRASGGTGLGLAIAKSLVERYGGRIEAEASPSQGSRFRILLARVRPDAPTNPAKTPPTLGIRP